MSKIGKKEIFVPEGVTVDLKDGVLVASGPKGSLEFKIAPEIKIEISERKILLTRSKETRQARTLQGTTRQKIANLITGVSQGWSKTLEVVGTGYRAALEEGVLVFSLGFSHSPKFSPPPGVTFSVAENKITVSGTDKELVGQVAAKIRQLRPPDSYKGKGIRYLGEMIKLKPGKVAKGAVGEGAKT